MAILDGLFLFICAISLGMGGKRGLIYEVLSVCSWICGFFFASWAAPLVSLWLPLKSVKYDLSAFAWLAAFLAIFIPTVFILSFFAWRVKKGTEAVGLRPTDRAFGALFGLVRGALVSVVIVVVVQSMSLQNAAWWKESLVAPWLTKALKEACQIYQLCLI